MGNRAKIIKILDIIKKTDKDNPITSKEIIDRLGDSNIKVERKSVYKCIKDLINEGYNIVRKGNKGYYWNEENEFEKWEIKVLIDAIWQCKFLSDSYCSSITTKLKSLINNREKKEIASVITSRTNLKLDTKEIPLNIENILEAINSQVKIKFQYTYIDVDENKKIINCPRYDGLEYIVNPYSLVWRKERYYLICNNDKYDDLSYYRVDRIINLKVLEEKIKPITEIMPNGDSDIIISEFVDKNLYQFIGEKIRVTVRCDKWMLGELFDYFGSDLIVLKVNEEKVEVSFSVGNGEGLYYWILQHGDNIELISPVEIRTEIKKILKNTLKLYK